MRIRMLKKWQSYKRTREYEFVLPLALWLIGKGYAERVAE